MSVPSNYGARYWCVKVHELSENGEIYVNADTAEVLPCGALVLRGGFSKSEQRPNMEQVVLALAPGQWSAIYAASCIDGAPVAVDHWAGERVEGG